MRLIEEKELKVRNDDEWKLLIRWVERNNKDFEERLKRLESKMIKEVK
jgi:hypothetical protein